MSNYFYDKGVCKTCGNNIMCDDRGRGIGYYLVCCSWCHESPMHMKDPHWIEFKEVDVNQISFRQMRVER